MHMIQEAKDIPDNTAKQKPEKHSKYYCQYYMLGTGAPAGLEFHDWLFNWLPIWSSLLLILAAACQTIVEML
eukprot:scaffold234320_cov17-Prasinocladus_malaysianus.AAC.1